MIPYSISFLSNVPIQGFSPHNSPHLEPALELDTAIVEFSASLAAKGLPTSIGSQQDVDTLANAFADEMKSLNLWQYYVLDVSATKASIKGALESGDIVTWDGADVAGKNVVDLAKALRDSSKIHGLGLFSGRFKVNVPGPVAAGFVQAAFVDITDVEALAEAWVRVIDVLNVPLYEEWEGDTKAALEGIKNRLKYTRLDEHGPKLGVISRELVCAYLWIDIQWLIVFRVVRHLLKAISPDCRLIRTWIP